MSPFEQLKHWPHGIAVIADWLGKGGEIVSQENAEARANICLKCPLHDAKTPLSRPVAKAVNQILSVLNSVNLTLRLDTKPNQCSVCGCDLRTKVWETLENAVKHSTRGELERYWDQCWIKNESK